MLNKIKNIANTEDKKRLLSNFFSLSILQGANYILPLRIFPYLVKVLGVEKYGLIAFAQAFIQYFNILTDYGFNLSATREISIHRENKEKVSEIFSSVMIIKFILLVVSLIIMSVIVFSFDKFKRDWLIYYLTFGIVIGQVLFPVWFFQGMERMKYITYLNILAKSIFTVAIFIFVQEQSDFWIVPLLTSVGFIIAGLWSLWIIKNNFNIKFKFQEKQTIIYHLYEGWYVFISGMYTLSYTLSIPLILGILTNNTILGYYSISEKIIKSISSLYLPLNQAIYPYVNKLIQTSEKKAKEFILKLLIFSGIIMLIISIIIYFSSEYIICFIAGEVLIEAVIVLKVLSLFPFIITIARIFSFNYIISFGYKKELSTLYFISALISIPITLLLIICFQEIGAALAVIIIESFVNILMAKLIFNKIGFKYYDK